MLALGLGTFLLVLAHSAPLLTWPYGDWSAVSAEARQALSLSGPWVAVCCAWTASRFTGVRGIVVSPAAIRAGGELVRAQMMRLAAVALLSFAVGISPVLLRTWVKAETGALNPVVLGGSLACLVAFASGGYLVGAVLPLRVAPAVAAVIALTSVLLADVLGPALSPVWTVGVVAGQQENPDVSFFRLFLFALTATCSVLAASWWLDARTFPTTPKSAGTLLVAAVPLALVLSPWNAGQAPVLHALDPPRSCVDVGVRGSANTASRVVEVCVHTARSTVLAQVSSSVERVLESAGALSTSVSRVDDANLWSGPGPGQIVLQLQPQDSGWENYVVEDLAFALSGSLACAEDLDGVRSREQTKAAVVSAGFAMWIADQSGVADADDLVGNPDAIAIYDRLGAMTTRQVQDLISGITGDLASCTASSAQLR